MCPAAAIDDFNRLRILIPTQAILTVYSGGDGGFVSPNKRNVALDAYKSHCLRWHGNWFARDPVGCVQPLCREAPHAPGPYAGHCGRTECLSGDSDRVELQVRYRLHIFSAAEKGSNFVAWENSDRFNFVVKRL
jgi:hypothetical protein